MTYDSGHFVGRDKFDSDSLLQGSFTLHLLRWTVGVGVVFGVVSGFFFGVFSRNMGEKRVHTVLYITVRWVSCWEFWGFVEE